MSFQVAVDEVDAVLPEPTQWCSPAVAAHLEASWQAKLQREAAASTAASAAASATPAQVPQVVDKVPESPRPEDVVPAPTSVLPVSY